MTVKSFLAYLRYLGVAVVFGVSLLNPSMTWSGEPLRLNLVWFNAHPSFPLAFNVMAGEVECIFAQLGVEVVWHRGPATELYSLKTPALKVILTPVQPATRGLPENTLGTAPRQGRSGTAVHIFLINVVDMFGFDLESKPRLSLEQERVIARAVGRVVSHEVLHVVLPHSRHSERGLMFSKLNPDFLRQPLVHVWPINAQDVRSGLRMLSSSPSPTARPDKAAHDERRGGASSTISNK